MPAGYEIHTDRTPVAAGPAIIALANLVPAIPIPAIPVRLDQPDPLTTWIQAARAAITAAQPQVSRSTIGPASTMAALLFEYWYGQRLLDLGRIPSILERPLLANPPRHPRAAAANTQDIKAIQQLLNNGENLILHELTHAIQSASDLVLRSPDWQDFRDTAAAIYDQAVQANLAGKLLDPPLEVLRGILNNESTFAGYVLPHDPSDLAGLRDQLLAEITPQTTLQVTGFLSYSGDHLALESMGQTYQLVNDRGTRFRLPGAGLDHGRFPGLYRGPPDQRVATKRIRRQPSRALLRHRTNPRLFRLRCEQKPPS